MKDEEQTADMQKVPGMVRGTAGCPLLPCNREYQEIIGARGCNHYDINTNLYAETKAMRDGLKIANGKRITQLWVGVDSMLLYNMVMGLCVVPWHLSYIFRKIISPLPAMFFISHDFREGNKTEDLMVELTDLIIF